jgi:hypothetical protein
MVVQILGIIGAILSIIIGLWKFFRGKDQSEQERKDKLKKAADDAIAKRDPSGITGVLDDCHRVRK